MEPLVLRTKGRQEVLFTLHLRAPDPNRRAPQATQGLVQGDDDHGRPECTTWITLNLRAERLPIAGEEETVRVEPTPQSRPEDGPALRRCAARALAALPKAFSCDPQDREDLAPDDPHHLMAFLEPPDHETLVAILRYYALGFGAAYPFMGDNPTRSTVRALVDGLSDFPSRSPAS